MIEIKCCLPDDRDTTKLIFAIRHSVFVVEQKVSREEEFDEFENSSIHYLGVVNGVPAATARWRITETGIKLERFAVLFEYRNKGVGTAVVNKVLSHVGATGLTIYLNAQVSAVVFYERAGFCKTGKMFMEAGIEHFKMTYKG
jgi:predicted GNAT family N-acyltransferase